jgi:exodeoxyribonuclease X
MTSSSSGSANAAGEGMDLTAPWTAYRYVVVDVEGNGQRPPDLVELAAVPINDGMIGEPRTWLVRPPRPITSMARRFHKISDADVADRPPVAEVAHEMHTALAGAVFVAHNAHVDLAVIGRELDYTPAYVVDTLKLARRQTPGQASYKLGALVEHFDLSSQDEGIPGMAAHRAGYDALMCASLLAALADITPKLTLSDLLDGPPKTPPEDSDAPALF